jgi:AraC-like DNA-binding protein
MKSRSLGPLKIQSSDLCSDWRVNTVLEWIQVHYSDLHLTLKSLSSHLGVSDKHLGQLFKHATGMSFHEYLARVRVDNAARMLIETPCRPIKDIASAVGYAAQTNLDRAFKSIHGMTPTVFRQHHVRNWEPFASIAVTGT